LEEFPFITCAATIPHDRHQATFRMITRRRFLRATAIASGLGLGVGVYTWRWEPHWVEVVERRLPVAHLPERLKGARLVQLSDLHIGPQVEDSYLIEVFERVKALAPEVVVITGDFTSYERNILAHVGRVFAHFPLGSRGTFGILGNHDYGPNWAHPEVADGIAAAAAAAGVRMLRNEIAEVDGLQIVGLDDLWAHRFDLTKALSALDPRRSSLVLSHNPDTADKPGWGDYDGWILAGHTHGGQCKPPFLPPPLLPVQNRRYTSGEFALSGGRRMYINRGVGHLLRVRFNARPEITLFHLDRL
jgi:hypothetical protein